LTPLSADMSYSWKALKWQNREAICFTNMAMPFFIFKDMSDLRKNTGVLWALTDDGIVLQKMSDNSFYELNIVQEKIWSLVDGTHDEQDIIEKVSETYANIPTGELVSIVNDTLALLHHNGLIAKL
jgi:hypothetical protein